MRACIQHKPDSTQASAHSIPTSGANTLKESDILSSDDTAEEMQSKPDNRVVPHHDRFFIPLVQANSTTLQVALKSSEVKNYCVSKEAAKTIKTCISRLLTGSFGEENGDLMCSDGEDEAPSPITVAQILACLEEEFPFDFWAFIGTALRVENAYHTEVVRELDSGYQLLSGVDWNEYFTTTAPFRWSHVVILGTRSQKERWDTGTSEESTVRTKVLQTTSIIQQTQAMIEPTLRTLVSKAFDGILALPSQADQRNAGRRCVPSPGLGCVPLMII